MLSSLFSTCLFALLSFFGGGEDTLRHLSPVEVSAQRVDQQMATHQLWRIEQREWQRQGTVHLADALRTLPGVQLRDYGGAGALVSLSSRGLGAAHTVVTVDGFPVGEMASGVVDLSRFRLSDVSQMQWSIADAPALLTSVRSLGAAHLALSTADLVPHIGVEWGSFGQVAVDAAAHRIQGAHTLGAEGSFARADNDFPYRVVNGNSYDYGRRQQSPWQRWQGAAFWRWQTATQRTQVRLVHQQQVQKLPGAVVHYTTRDGEDLQTAQSAVQLSHRGRNQSCAWQWAGQYATQHLNYVDFGREYPKGLREEDYRQQQWWSSLGGEVQLAPSWQMAYAVDATHTALHSNMGRFDEVARMALQQSVSLRFAHQCSMLTLRLLRHDFWHQVQGRGAEAYALMPWETTTVATDAHRWTWSCSAAQQLWQWRSTRGTLRGVVQTLFRMPSFTENYYHHYGNADLRPERTQQMSVGLSVERVPQASSLLWKGSVDVYHNRVLDRILGIPVNQNVWRTTNLDRVNAIGLDLSAQLRCTIAPRQAVEGTFTASWQRVTDESNRTSPTYGLQLPYTPEFTAHLVLVWSHPWCDVSLTGDYCAERQSTANHWPAARLAPYATLHTAVGRTFRWGNTEWLTQGVINNVTNTHYELVRGYPLPGRSVMWRNIISF